MMRGLRTCWPLLLLILSFSCFCGNLSEARLHNQKHASAEVVGAVFCDTCFQDDMSKGSHYILGATVAVECAEGEARPAFYQEVKTDKQGKFKVHLPFSVSKHVKEIQGCEVKLVKSSEPYCSVASTASSSLIHLKEKQGSKHIYSAGFFTFKPIKQPELCNQQPSVTKSNLNSLGDAIPGLPMLPMPGLPSLPVPMPGLPTLPVPMPEIPAIPMPGLPTLPVPVPPLPITNPLTPTIPGAAPLLPNVPLPPLPPLPPMSEKPVFPTEEESKVEDGAFAQPQQLFPPLIPPLFPSPPSAFPNPFAPPALLPPNPLQPPAAPSFPTIPNPFQPPTPPPGLFPPLPPMPTIPGIPGFPTVPGLTQPPPSPPPPASLFPPIFPGFPGITPADQLKKVNP